MTMNLQRVLRHLSSSRRTVRRAFPAEALAAIERAIQSNEAAHDGEIVFAVEAALDTVPLLRGQTARDRALELFSQLRVWDTERNNGVLIYVLMADRDVEIVADRGIHARAGEEAWKEICGEMEQAFRRGDFQAGALAGIAAVSRHLERHSGPARANELSDKPVVR